GNAGKLQRGGIDSFKYAGVDAEHFIERSVWWFDLDATSGAGRRRGHDQMFPVCARNVFRDAVRFRRRIDSGNDLVERSGACARTGRVDFKRLGTIDSQPEKARVLEVDCLTKIGRACEARAPGRRRNSLS